MLYLVFQFYLNSTGLLNINDYSLVKNAFDFSQQHRIDRATHTPVPTELSIG
jgi:hypothetical protein